MDIQNTSSDSTRKSFFKNPFSLFFMFFIVVTVIALGIKAYQVHQKQPVMSRKTIIKQTLVRRSKDLGLISRGLTGKAIDVNTGKIVKAARVFSPDDKTVYLELDLNAPPKGTIIDYLRYKDGRYVDHGEVAIAKANTSNVLFNWTINKLLGNVRNGKWRVATYANGILAKRINYVMTNNKVSFIYPDQPITPSDPDYQLNKTFFLVSKGY